MEFHYTNIAPGPYFAEGNKVKSLEGGRLMTLADCRNPRILKESQEGHAQMFAASWALFEALKEELKRHPGVRVGLCPVCHHYGIDCTANKAREALKQARGR